MKTKKIILGLVVVLIIAAGVVYTKAIKSVPQDGENAKVVKFENLRDVRYAEVFLIGGNGITKNLSAAFYNTSDLNNEVDHNNTCPQELWDKIDVDQLKKEYNVLSAFKNGPRHWTNDWIEIPVGKELDFSGLKARWFGEVVLPKVNLNEKGSTAYKPTQVARKSKMGFNTGEPIFVLVDPQGRPWAMQAYGLIVDPSQTYEGLFSLDKKLKGMAATGWSFKVITLEKDLIIHADSEGIAYIVQDELVFRFRRIGLAVVAVIKIDNLAN